LTTPPSRLATAAGISQYKPPPAAIGSCSKTRPPSRHSPHSSKHHRADGRAQAAGAARDIQGGAAPGAWPRRADLRSELITTIASRCSDCCQLSTEDDDGPGTSAPARDQHWTVLDGQPITTELLRCRCVDVRWSGQRWKPTVTHGNPAHCLTCGGAATVDPPTIF
jgi:hypothetical protein